MVKETPIGEIISDNDIEKNGNIPFSIRNMKKTNSRLRVGKKIG
jgi:hypothetical protein